MLRIATSLCLPDEVHDFVLPLPGNIGIREDHLDIFPASIIVQSVLQSENCIFTEDLVFKGQHT